ncbi:MAG: hybrid sensor histidine kinase/response regulator [Bacteroidota bacterium]
MNEYIATILVVDDTEDNLDLLEFAMKHKPVKMFRATSGMECLAIAESVRPDVILLDIQMPEMDGFETFRRLRAKPSTAKIPVIFLTAQRKDPGSIATGLEIGADEYLTKPIDTEELLVRTRMLIRLKRAEAAIERTRADFMAMLVHDLRSPLSGIKSVIDFFTDLKGQEVTLTPEYFQLLESGRDAAGRMLELINNLLDLSKFEAGNMALDKKSVIISQLIDAVVHEVLPQYQQRRISLTQQTQLDLPIIEIDLLKISQVLMNLLSNALKFTRSGGSVEVSAQQIQMPPGEKPAICFSITDNGIGIGKEELPYVFDRYKQASSAQVTKTKGTGLGLAICKLVVEAHGGMVYAESEPGVRTTFSFTLPITSTI